MKVFFSVPNSDIADVCECGLKISEYKNRTLTVNGREVDFISAYLNPNDADTDEKYTVIRLIPDDGFGYIAEGAFYEEHLLCVKSGGDDFWLKKYESTMIPVSDYKLGRYRKPEYLIKRTLFANQIELFDKRKGEPILYNNSEELYIGGAVRRAEDICDNFYETAVRAVYERQGSNYIEGQKYKIFTEENGDTVFIVKNN